MSEIQEAARREESFIGNLADAQDDYEWIVEHRAWLTLGYDSFADWWSDRVTPIMRALSMRPTREIAASVVEQVRAEEVELPPAQRRTQRELAELAGVHRNTLYNQDRPQAQIVPTPDLEEPAPAPAPARTPVADPLPPQIAQRIEERIAEKRQINDAHRKLRADLEAIPEQTKAEIADLGRRIDPVVAISMGCESLLESVSGVDPAAVSQAPEKLRYKLAVVHDALDYLTRVADAMNRQEIAA